MKMFTWPCLACAIFLLSSCATLIPPRHPDMSREEFQGMVSGSSEKTACYESGFRGGMLFLDFVLGAPFLWIPIIVDGVGGRFTAYYYDHERCEKVKSQERDARLSRDYGSNVENGATTPRPEINSRKKVKKTIVIETEPDDDEYEYEDVY